MKSLYLTEINPNNQNTIREKETTKIQDLYLRYLINEETIYADIDKIEACYLKRSIENYQRYNIKKIILHEKEEIYNSIILQIMNEMFQHYEIQKKSLMTYYETRIYQLKHEIRIREHQNETYKNSYNRLYHSNYMIKKRLDVEQRFASIFSRQHSNYRIIKQHASMDVNKQQKMLSEMIEYNDKMEIEDRFNERSKGNKISELEFSVNMIKKDIVLMAHSLREIKEKSYLVQKKLKERKKINESEINSYYFKLREYHKKNIQLLTIFEDLHVTNLDNLIFKFIKIKGELQTLHSVFGFENKEIQLLNNASTELEDILNSYKTQIADNNKNKPNAFDNMTISKQITKISKQYFISEDIDSSIHKKQLLLQLILNFLLQGIKRVVPGIDVKTITNNSNLLLLLKSNKYIMKIDKNLLKLICSLFILFSNSFIWLLYHSFNIVISQQPAYSSSNVLYHKGNGVIYYLYKKEYLNSLRELSNKAMLTLESKIRLIKKNEKQMISDMNKKKAETSTIIYRQGISQSKLFSSFIGHIESQNKEITRKNSKSQMAKIRNYLIENHPRKIMSFARKYQNELVFKEKLEKMKAMRGTRNKQFIQKSISCPLTLKKKKQEKEKEKEHAQSTYDKDDSYDAHQNDNMKTGRNNIPPRIADVNDEKEQTAKIYKRLNDLRNLELKYKDNHYNKEIKDLYVALQKKYSKMGSFMKKYTNSSFKKTKSGINEDKGIKRDMSFCQISSKTKNNKLNQLPFVSRNKSNKCFDRTQNKTFFSSIIR